jgi:hypothetical protein
MRYFLYIFLALLLSTGCSTSQNLSHDYFLFKSKYRLGSSYRLDTKTSTEDLFSNMNNLTLIDSIYLVPLKLVETTKNDKEWGIKRLADYDCRLISFTENEKYDCVVSISYTSTAGDGDPIILVNTNDKFGKFISQARFELVFQHDYSPVPKQYFSIDKTNKISLELTSKNYKIVDSLGAEVLKYISTDYNLENYLINLDGVILKQNE